MLAQCCHTLPADSLNLVQNVELLFETSSTSHLENPNCCTTVRAAQRKHEILTQNMPPNRSKSSFSLICKILSSPKRFPVNFLEHLVCSTTCMTKYVTKSLKIMIFTFLTKTRVLPIRLGWDFANRKPYVQQIRLTTPGVLENHFKFFENLVTTCHRRPI